MKSFICNFMGKDIYLDNETDKDAIELIHWQRKQIEEMSGDSVDASMYCYVNATIENLK